MWRCTLTTTSRRATSSCQKLHARFSTTTTKKRTTTASYGCVALSSATAALSLHLSLRENDDAVSGNESLSWNHVARCDARMLGNIQNSLAKRSTIRKLQDTSSLQSLDSKYDVNWNRELGRGGYATVYFATNRETKERVAIKKISKQAMDREDFQREMNALLHLQGAGGHPNICSLHEHFDEGDHYYVVLDLIEGGEMFDYLVSNGAFSEHDASRLVREVASALAFLHGLDTVHGDLKPENLLLSTKNSQDAVVKVVDFGCAQVTDPDSPYSEDFDDLDGGLADDNYSGTTPGYCPAEVLERRDQGITKHDPSMDLYSLGIILYIMLTGVHPYDVGGTGDDDELVRTVLARKPPPLKNSPITAHLSDSAIDVLQKLITPDPSKRLSAIGMLDHPWVKGETASRSKIADSGKKLSMLLQTTAIENMIDLSDSDMEGQARKVPVVELAFRKIFPTSGNEEDCNENAPPSLSHFSDLLAQNMKNIYFPKDHVVYEEGDIGNHMYLISAGQIEVVTKDGTSVTRGPGNFFGEGALLHPKSIRSASVLCKTPLHVLEISRGFFDQHLAKTDTNLYLTLKEKDKIRKRNRAKRILRLQKNLKERNFDQHEVLFKAGQKDDDALFLVESGLIDIWVEGDRVLSATPGNICGEYSALTGRPRNCTATCATKEGCKTRVMTGEDFRRLADSSPELSTSLSDLCLRRDFKKAVVLHLKREFPYHNIQQAYDALLPKGGDGLDVNTVGKLMRKLDPSYTDEEILEFVRAIDLRNTGKINFDEFEKVFISKQLKRDWL